MKIVSLFFFFWFYLMILSACENDLETVKRITHKSSDPDERTLNMQMVYTDSGFAKVLLRSKLSETFLSPKRIIRFKKGLEVSFFNSKGKVKSILTANFGEVELESGDMIVRDSVCLKNVLKNQYMLTEELHWNQKTESVFTNRSVIVHTNKKVLYGDGIQTNQDFSEYVFLKPKGSLLIEN